MLTIIFPATRGNILSSSKYHSLREAERRTEVIAGWTEREMGGESSSWDAAMQVEGLI